MAPLAGWAWWDGSCAYSQREAGLESPKAVRARRHAHTAGSLGAHGLGADHGPLTTEPSHGPALLIMLVGLYQRVFQGQAAQEMRCRSFQDTYCFTALPRADVGSFFCIRVGSAVTGSFQTQGHNEK